MAGLQAPVTGYAQVDKSTESRVRVVEALPHIQNRSSLATTTQTAQRKASGRYASGRHVRAESGRKGRNHQSLPGLVPGGHESGNNNVKTNENRLSLPILAGPNTANTGEGAQGDLEACHSLPDLFEPAKISTDRSNFMEMNPKDWKFDKAHKSWCQEMEKRERDRRTRAIRKDLKAETRVSSIIDKIRLQEEKRIAREREHEIRRKQLENDHKTKMQGMLRQMHERLQERTNQTMLRFKATVRLSIAMHNRESEMLNKMRKHLEAPSFTTFSGAGDELPALEPGEGKAEEEHAGKDNKKNTELTQVDQPQNPATRKKRLSLIEARKLGRKRGDALAWCPPPPGFFTGKGKVETIDESVWIKPGEFRTVSRYT
mmetsp:Transcript_24415/g.46266  ORF Transcript_24415/g.46266 Transcript_24415/m.46266 type:complete len:373 (-) Transcript_24415:135-1253(-)